MDESTPAEQARTLLQRERQERILACKVTIETALKEHRCHLDISILLKAGQVIPQMEIVADE